MRGGDIGRTFVTDPDGTIEPVEGVKGRVARSKDLVATTTEDLKQYHRWLKDYLASEKRDRDRHMRRLRPQHLADVDVPHISSSNRPVSIVGVLLIGGALVTTGFVWEHMNEAIPLDTSRGQRGSEQTVLEPKLSHDTEAQRLQPSAPEALMKEKVDAERRPSAHEISPSVAHVDKIETVPVDIYAAQRGSEPSLTSSLTTEAQGLQPSAPQAPMEQKAAAQPTELKPTAGAELATETLRPNEPAWENARDHESRGNAPFTSEASPQGTSQHATANSPDLSAEPSSQHGTTPNLSAEPSSQHGTTPDLSTEAPIPFSQLPSVAEVPPEAPVLTSEPPASSLSDDAVPPPDEISIEEAREGETKKAPVVDPAARLANQHASSNEAERSPLDNPGLPLRKPSSRDVSVAEQPPANRHVRADPRRRAPIAEDSRVTQLERSVDVPRSTARTQSVSPQERKWPRRRTEGPRPGLGLFIFAPPGF